MKHLIVIAALVAFAAFPAFGSMVLTFDADTENTINMTHVSSGGNGGGYYHVSNGASLHYMLADHAWEAGTSTVFTLDVRGTFSGNTLTVQLDIAKQGGGKDYSSYNIPIPNGTYTSWTTFSKDLGPFAFTPTSWDQSSITQMPGSGAGGYDLDNYGFVPEPASLSLLGIGGVLALIRRRKR